MPTSQAAFPLKKAQSKLPALLTGNSGESTSLAPSKKPPRGSQRWSSVLNGQSLASLKNALSFAALGLCSFRPGRISWDLALSAAGTRFAWLFSLIGEPVRRWLPIYKQSLCRLGRTVKSTA